MNRILEGLDGVVCLVDDILIFGATQEEHDARLLAVLQRLEKAEATLNLAKCKFHKSTIKFVGHIASKDGICADPEKTAAICNMEPPQSVSDLRRFMGLVNQLGKFSSRIAEISQPLRELLQKGRAWVWGPEQENCSLRSSWSWPNLPCWLYMTPKQTQRYLRTLHHLG